jgi:hypothetical protein
VWIFTCFEKTLKARAPSVRYNTLWLNNYTTIRMPLPKRAKNYYGWIIFCRRLVLFKTNMCYLLIDKVLFILVRIQFIVSRNTLMWSIIRYVMVFMVSCWISKVHMMIMVLIWWLKCYQEGSLKHVVISPVWRFPPHICEGKICWFWAPFLCGANPKFDSQLCPTCISERRSY